MKRSFEGTLLFQGRSRNRNESGSAQVREHADLGYGSRYHRFSEQPLPASCYVEGQPLKVDLVKLAELGYGYELNANGSIKTITQLRNVDSNNSNNNSGPRRPSSR